MEEGRVAGDEEEIEEMIGEGEKRGLGDWETGRRGDQEHVKNISPSPFLPLFHSFLPAQLLSYNLRDILPKNIKLNIDNRLFFYLMKICHLICEGDNCHLEGPGL
jgi:hypothetical protein